MNWRILRICTIRARKDGRATQKIIITQHAWFLSKGSVRLEGHLDAWKRGPVVVVEEKKVHSLEMVSQQIHVWLLKVAFFTAIFTVKMGKFDAMKSYDLTAKLLNDLCWHFVIICILSHLSTRPRLVMTCSRYLVNRLTRELAPTSIPEIGQKTFSLKETPLLYKPKGLDTPGLWLANL